MLNSWTSLLRFVRPLTIRSLFLAVALAHVTDLNAQNGAQTQQDELAPTSLSYSDPIEFRWKVGCRIVGGADKCKNMIVTLPLPSDWPEQTAVLDSEDIPSEVRVTKYRTLDGGVKQLIMLLPSVPANEEILISQTYRVRVSRIEGAQQTNTLEIPKRVEKVNRPYLGVSPMISYRNSKMRAKVKEITADHETAWAKVEAIFDWVRENIELHEEESEDTLSVFRARAGNTEDKVALFVGMCRALKVPARMVWVDGNQTAEFFLINEEGYGNWYPCQVAGPREFGSMSDVRVVLQKGDNFKVPEKEAPQKFVAEFAITKGKVRPSVEFSRELLPEQN